MLVNPAEAGIQLPPPVLDPRLRRGYDDGSYRALNYCVPSSPPPPPEGPRLQAPMKIAWLALGEAVRMASTPLSSVIAVTPPESVPCEATIITASPFFKSASVAAGSRLRNRLKSGAPPGRAPPGPPGGPPWPPGPPGPPCWPPPEGGGPAGRAVAAAPPGPAPLGGPPGAPPFNAKAIL